jgi:probable rRNA maturation factor
VVDLDFLHKILDELTSDNIELIITNKETIQQINKEYRDIDKPTDVLSFPLEQIEGMPLGSVVICEEIARQKAQELDHSFNEELSLMFIHGVLHCLGYDHEIDNGEHREKEIELIKKFDLPKSLIVRTQE